MVNPYVPAYKIGSDITWAQHLKNIALKGKPVLLACGASTLDDCTCSRNNIFSKL